MEEDYNQVVYSIVHSISRKGAASENCDHILDYAKTVFQYDNIRHENVVDYVKTIKVSCLL